MTISALPWRTGTSINPLLRAAYLSKEHKVELVLPECKNIPKTSQFKFAEKEDIRQKSFSYLDQALPINKWNRKNITINFYEGIYKSFCDSIYPKKSILDYPFQGDILIIQDPLQLFLQPSFLPDFKTLFLSYPMKRQYGLVIGIIETNHFYFIPEITRNSLEAWLWKTVLKLLGNFFLSQQCDAIIAVSSTFPRLHKNFIIENVNGVHDKFFYDNSLTSEKKGLYYIGKLTHLKNVDKLLEFAVRFKLKIDFFGGILDVPRELPKKLRESYDQRMSLCREWLRTDHINYKSQAFAPEEKLLSYSTFINFSESEGLCTTTAEALAMGKFVIIPDHPSNDFFKSFKNALIFTKYSEVIGLIHQINDSQPVYDSTTKQLSWSNANKRLMNIIQYQRQSKNGSIAKTSRQTDIL
ncbi:MAG: hypothetical protein ACFCBU_00020 [Cyanophyceae cyanobacterium]